MAARENILARIRKAQGRGGRPSEAELEELETYLRAHPRGPQPKLGADLVARFRACAEALNSTTEAVASEREAPLTVARYLTAEGVQAKGCVWPALAHLDWKAAGLDLAPRRAEADDPVGVTGALAAIAETGTLMVASGADTPSSVSLLPETHVAIVPAASIVATMEDAWDLARAKFGRFPRAVSFISGPSRTGDIEQTIVIGAHGPYRVHLIIVG